MINAIAISPAIVPITAPAPFSVGIHPTTNAVMVIL